MQKEEYQEKIKQIQNEDIPEGIPTSDTQDEFIDEEETKKLIEIADEKIPVPEEEKVTSKKYEQGTVLKQAPELKDFLQTKESIQLGTKARVAVPLNINGQIVKVYVRGISGEELKQIQNDAETTGQDPNHLAACIACTDKEGNPYPSEVLESLGYARERQIGEAITITSGENSEYTTENIQKQVVENLTNG